MPEDTVSALSVESALLLDEARTTVTVVICWVTPSSAVTTTLTVLLPTFRATAPDALPLPTLAPLTLTVAALLVVVGVRVTEVTP